MGFCPLNTLQLQSVSLRHFSGWLRSSINLHGVVYPRNLLKSLSPSSPTSPKEICIPTSSIATDGRIKWILTQASEKISSFKGKLINFEAALISYTCCKNISYMFLYFSDMDYGIYGWASKNNHYPFLKSGVIVVHGILIVLSIMSKFEIISFVCSTLYALH